ncbi:MAG: riboflavin synthase [Flavobacteriaceae bacterium]|nr:riboflavin synthase [Flavobacteriaceae bacterium]MCY4216938.1 riboflavin synthase [Flavobacteriaceae bacterium]MCY4253535.1 riboflavin synthase [Flavobacteriaceae bacterium]
MFSGIVESMGIIESIHSSQNSKEFIINSHLSSELTIGQSISHNGVCLTVTKFDQSTYGVTAISETLQRSNLGLLGKGSYLNLERSLKMGDPLDGHLVQGHVDQIAVCIETPQKKGPGLYRFECHHPPKFPIIEKGSICLDGISFTVVDTADSQFSIYIIPYSYQSTNMQFLERGTQVNIEFDIIGKYITKLYEREKGTSSNDD